MSEAIIITPVKNSLETTKQTIEAINKSKGDFEYIVFNDFSEPETKQYLEKAKNQFNFEVIHLEDITNTPSPNYKLVLQTAQKLALKKNLPLVIIESDVVVKEDTLPNLIDLLKTKQNPGIIGAITVDKAGNYNFPYTFEKNKSNEVVDTSRSLSFCCTLISPSFLAEFDFKKLADTKDWFDVFISRQSKKWDTQTTLQKVLKYCIYRTQAAPGKT